MTVLAGCTEWLKSNERGLSRRRLILMAGDTGHAGVFSSKGKSSLIVIERSDKKAGGIVARITRLPFELIPMRVLRFVAGRTDSRGIPESNAFKSRTGRQVGGMARVTGCLLMLSGEWEVRLIVIKQRDLQPVFRHVARFAGKVFTL